MTAISISLTNSDWDQRRGGWHCAALKVPGAEVSGLFSRGEKVDNARYGTDAENEIVRWPGLDHFIEPRVRFRPRDIDERIVNVRTDPALCVFSKCRGITSVRRSMALNCLHLQQRHLPASNP